MKRLLLSWSSGKDSAWSLHLLQQQNEYEIVGLLTTFNQAANRAPRGVQKTFDAVFATLNQERRPRPKPRRWAQSIIRDFKRDPLLDSKGKRMIWVRRIAPKWLLVRR